MPQKPSDGRQYAALAAFALIYAAAIASIANPYYQLMMTLVPLWATMGVSWNVLSGYSGLVSFGHASFFGLGAFTTTLLLIKFDLTPWIGIPISALVGACAGLMIGFPTFRLKGYYFSLAMLAYPLAFLNIFEWLGLQEISIPMKREHSAFYFQFSDGRVYSALALALLLVAMLISLAVERSRFGMALVSIKQNEPAAEAAGIDTFRWKLKAIMLSAGIAGAVGGLYAVVLLVVTPASVFGLVVSAEALIVAMFGGVGTIWGPIIGAAILIPLSEALTALMEHSFPGVQGAVYGLAVIVVVLVAPEGIFWRISDLLASRRAKKGTAELRMPVSPVVTEPAHEVPKRHSVQTAYSGPILRVTGLGKSFAGLQALHDVSFDVVEGTILGIIGPNGAGKTTLFNLLDGFLRPSQGSISLRGREIVGLKPNQICRLGVGRTFQVVRAFERMSVQENVAVGALELTASRLDAMRAAAQALHRVGLAAKAGSSPGQLTTVELRLMELARALASDPALLLMDETLAGLGSEEVERMLEVIRSLPKDGTTVVIIEHTMEAMVRLVERFVVLDHGRTIASGEPSAVLKDSRVIEAYLGKKWMAASAAN